MPRQAGLAHAHHQKCRCSVVAIMSSEETKYLGGASESPFSSCIFRLKKKKRKKPCLKKQLYRALDSGAPRSTAAPTPRLPNLGQVRGHFSEYDEYSSGRGAGSGCAIHSPLHNTVMMYRYSAPRSQALLWIHRQTRAEGPKQSPRSGFFPEGPVPGRLPHC